MDQVVDWLARNDISLLTLLASGAILIATSIAILVLNRLLRQVIRRIETRLPLPYATALIATRVVTVSLWLVAAMLALSPWGVGVGGLWTLLVSAAAVIGVGFLAVWTIVSNITAGVFITVWRPFHLGQIVELLPENLKGRVIDRSMMFTTLREEGGSVLQVPNNLFFQKMFRVTDRREPSLFESLEGKGMVDAGKTTPQ
jgi:small-conductance mechanosensitive channel